MVSAAPGGGGGADRVSRRRLGLPRALASALRTPAAFALVGHVVRTCTVDHGKTGEEPAHHALRLLPVLLPRDAQRCRALVRKTISF